MRISDCGFEASFGATDREEARLRRQCAEILAELPQDVSESEAQNALERTIAEARQEVDERAQRRRRQERKAALLREGVSEVSTYLSQLRREGVISSDEHFDSRFTNDLRKAVTEGLEDELSGDENGTEVRGFVQEVIDDELD